MIKTIKRLWKEAKDENAPASKSNALLMETLLAKEEWQIHAITLEQLAHLKKLVRGIAIVFAIIGFILGSIIF